MTKALAARLRELSERVTSPDDVTALAACRDMEDVVDDNIETICAALEGVEEMRASKDAAYLERNRLVAFLARQFPSGIAKTAIYGWSDDWHGCVYIDTTAGQLSWHYHDSHAFLFEGLPPYAGKWDGHTTDEKYERLARAAKTPPPDDVTIARMNKTFREAAEKIGVAREGQLKAALAQVEEMREALAFDTPHDAWLNLARSRPTRKSPHRSDPEAMKKHSPLTQENQMKKFPKHYRQGDVLIIEAAGLPKGADPVAREGGRVILAHGELTGHAHAIKAPAVTHHVKGGRHYFAVGDAPAALEHEEHKTINFDAGKVFRHARQVEYSPQVLRNVAD